MKKIPPLNLALPAMFFLFCCGRNPGQNEKNGKSIFDFRGNRPKSFSLRIKNNLALPPEDDNAIPLLNDSVLLCFEGAFPFYVSCEDAGCAQKIFYPGGNLKASGRCTNGKRSGLWTSYFENGKVMEKGIIGNGFPLGQWIFYF